MYDRARTIDRIERAIDAHPFCPACGSPTEVVGDDGVLLLRCRASALPSGLRDRLDAALRPHLMRVIVAVPESDVA